MSQFINSVELKKIFSNNFLNLFIIQLINFSIPILSYPILIERIGIGLFGELAIIQTYYTILSILINFGTSYSSVKIISQNKFNNRILANVFFFTYLIKITIGFVSFIFLLIINLKFNLFYSNKLIIYGIGYISFELFVPVWYLIAKEKNKKLNLYNALSKILYLILLFVLINKLNFYLTPLLMLISNLFIGILVVKFSLGEINFSFNKLTVRYFYPFIIRSSKVLSLDLISAIFVNTNKIILSTLNSSAVIGKYDIAQKISIALKTPIRIFALTFFPIYSSGKSVKKIISLIILLLICVYTVFFYSLSDPLIYYLSGIEDVETIIVLKNLIITIPFVFISMYYIDLRLITYNRFTPALRIKALSFLTFLLIIFYLKKYSEINLINLSLAYLIGEIICALSCIVNWFKYDNDL